MTIIAWDGKTLAADKRMSSGGMPRTTTKIFRVRTSLCGAAGNADQCAEMIAWFKSGAEESKFPSSQRDKDDWATLVVIDKDGIRFYERTPYPCVVEDKFYATGSGRDFATAAMHCGKSAREAVEIASLFDIGCGNGIDELNL